MPVYLFHQLNDLLQVAVIVQVFIHNPHSGALQGGRAVASHDNDISILNINQQVSAVATGQLNNSGCDTLLVGTPTNFLAYDVENNSDLFYRDVSDLIWIASVYHVCLDKSYPRV